MDADDSYPRTLAQFVLLCACDHCRHMVCNFDGSDEACASVWAGHYCMHCAPSCWHGMKISCTRSCYVDMPRMWKYYSFMFITQCSKPILVKHNTAIKHRYRVTDRFGRVSFTFTIKPQVKLGVWQVWRRYSCGFMIHFTEQLLSSQLPAAPCCAYHLPIITWLSKHACVLAQGGWGVRLHSMAGHMLQQFRMMSCLHSGVTWSN